MPSKVALYKYVTKSVQRYNYRDIIIDKHQHMHFVTFKTVLV